MDHDRDLARRIDDLRMSFRLATEFEPVVRRFYDELVEYPPFLEASTQARNPLIEQTVALGVEYLVGRGDALMLVLLRVAKHGMWHGSLHTGKSFGSFFAFEATGQLCVTLSGLGGRTHFLRMMWQPVLESGAIPMGTSVPRGVA